ncbi:hypothetical protein T05_11740 [Trichinella murrelli]|uniref:Uncharacterized protein n=1 Tax=Trichinella murrelli TaxID=144512 RepID=A0A0V0TQ01_9BILA|nr:hypothetical protein T05_11740 [Trichinella murrelli]
MVPVTIFYMYPLVRTVTLIPWLLKTQPYCKVKTFIVLFIFQRIGDEEEFENNFPRKLQNFMSYRLGCFCENRRKICFRNLEFFLSFNPLCTVGVEEMASEFGILLLLLHGYACHFLLNFSKIETYHQI